MTTENQPVNKLGLPRGFLPLVLSAAFAVGVLIAAARTDSPSEIRMLATAAAVFFCTLAAAKGRPIFVAAWHRLNGH
jgi:hypothetical protein